MSFRCRNIFQLYTSAWDCVTHEISAIASQSLPARHPPIIPRHTALMIAVQKWGGSLRVGPHVYAAASRLLYMCVYMLNPPPPLGLYGQQPRALAQTHNRLTKKAPSYLVVLFAWLFRVALLLAAVIVSICYSSRYSKVFGGSFWVVWWTSPSMTDAPSFPTRNETQSGAEKLFDSTHKSIILVIGIFPFRLLINRNRKYL
jgi:hypothetical protein